MLGRRTGDEVEGLSVQEWDGPGFRTLVRFGSWCCAQLNDAPMFNAENFSFLERHPNTDETFVLMDGSATLLIGPAATRIEMEKFKFYNVAANTWHHIFTRPGARVLIVENADAIDDRRNISQFSIRYDS